MKKQKIFEFALAAGLDDARRAALELAIEEAAEANETDLEYGWQEDDDSRLHVFVKPVEIEVRFQGGRAELHAAAPLWAKAHFTAKRQAEVRDLVAEILRDALLLAPEAA